MKPRRRSRRARSVRLNAFAAEVSRLYRGSRRRTRAEFHPVFDLLAAIVFDLYVDLLDDRLDLSAPFPRKS